MLTLADVRAAAERIDGQLLRTPMIPDPVLSARLQRPVWLKLESLQTTGSFKARGALNWTLTASDAELRPGLGAVSAGNHALALAWTARQRQVPVTIVMPENASPLKVQGSRDLGAEVILHGDITQAWARMHELIAEHGLTLVHPYDNERIMAGQGTVALEVLEQQPEVDTIVCPIGGGGLIGGMGVAGRALRPELALLGVEPAGAASMAYAWAHGGPQQLEHVRTWAKSLGAAIVGETTYPACRAHTTALYQVPDTAIRAAVKHLLQVNKLVAEPGAAVATALMRAMDPADVPGRGDIAIVVTGGNADHEELCGPA